MKTIRLLCLLVAGIALAASARGQERFTLSGYVKDKSTVESLIGANIYVKDNPSKGTATNTYGFYSLTLEKGSYVIVFNYLGFADQEITVNLTKNTSLSVDMEEGIALEEVVVTAEDVRANVESTRMGTVETPMELVKKLPAVFGEVDVLKTLQLLPGVLSAGEGNAGFYVRGGGPDQNLVLLDEALVYNSGHLLGFFSVFNADALKNTTLIKGGMPAQYGGRLSSVVDIQMKEGNQQRYAATGGIGLIASRLTFEGPLVRDKASFIVSARRTYALDLAQPFLRRTNFAGTNYYFYDLNAKVNYTLSDKDRLYASAYFGRDVLMYKSSVRDFFFDLPYGNATATLRWNHLLNDKLFLNVSAIYNDYDFGFGGGQGDFTVDVFSGVRDYNLKLDFDYYPSPEHHLRYGGQYIFHKLTPNVTRATNGEQTFSNNQRSTFAHEGAFYIQDDMKIGSRLGLNLGLRWSWFTQLGPYVSSVDGRAYGEKEPVKTYNGLEPRLAFRYTLSPVASLKAGITFTNQYLHLVSNSTSTLPTDVWVASSERIKPQRGIQYALGYFRNIADNRYEVSVEAYYRDLQNQIDYRENYVNNVASELEREFVFGRGRAYGLELFVNKKKGDFTGWIGYTLSRTERIFPDINAGQVFPAVYDRTHDLSLVASYQPHPKWEISAVWIYGTGQAYTPLRSLYFIDQNLVQEYGVRNSARLQPYHRGDLSATYVPKPNAKGRFSSSWAFSVYNVYNRRNPFFIYYDLEADANAGTAQAKAFKVSLFPVIPSVTWNFRWQSK